MQAAGAPSARTLLLLYAADLAFRLRWEIRPALAEGRTVVAAPYVDTAMAFGRAAGVPVGWLTNLFRFAPPAAERRFVTATARRRRRATGLWDFGVPAGCTASTARARRQLIGDAAAHLRAEAKRRAPSHETDSQKLRQRTAGAVGGDLRLDGVAASRRERLEIRDRLLELRVREYQRVGERRRRGSAGTRAATSASSQPGCTGLAPVVGAPAADAAVRAFQQRVEEQRPADPDPSARARPAGSDDSTAPSSMFRKMK